MDNHPYEIDLVDRAVAVVTAHNRQGSAPLVLDIERSIGMVFDGWEPPDPDHWDLYRELCFEAADGRTRDWLLGYVRIRSRMSLAEVLAQTAALAIRTEYATPFTSRETGALNAVAD